MEISFLDLINSIYDEVFEHYNYNNDSVRAVDASRRPRSNYKTKKTLLGSLYTNMSVLTF